MKYNRRSFISFLGKASLGAIVVRPFLMSSGNSTTPTTVEKIAEATLERLKKVVFPRNEMNDRLLYFI